MARLGETDRWSVSTGMERKRISPLAPFWFKLLDPVSIL